MKFCPNCAAPIVKRVPPGDSLPRDVCDACGSVHYQNPKLVVGSVPEWEDRILLCRRAIEPRYGYWTLPAGFMENGETVEHGAAREADEEALAKVKIGSLIAGGNVLRAQKGHMIFWAQFNHLGVGAGPENLGGKVGYS